MLGQHKVSRSAAIIVVGVGFIAGGCRTDREITRPDPVPVTEELVTDALLTVEDLPAGFTAAAESTPINADVIPEHECDDAITELEAEETGSADFTGSGTLLTNPGAYFPGDGRAVEELYRDVAEDCAEVVVEDQGLSLRTEALDFGVLSDDALALKFELELADGRIEERDLIVMRLGDLVSIVRLTGPRPSDKVLLDSVVRTALGRLGLASDLATN